MVSASCFFSDETGSEATGMKRPHIFSNGLLLLLCSGNCNGSIILQVRTNAVKYINIYRVGFFLFLNPKTDFACFWRNPKTDHESTVSTLEEDTSD